MTEGCDISEFGRSGDFYISGGIDFSSAQRLKSEGSTCDTYVTVLQRRKVFVKRLKKEFRNSPLYRAAFDKEFDLGVGLSHISLPRYIALGDDYIVMDYIEGSTLAEQLARRRSQSGSVITFDKRFRKKVLGELVDVIDYLHRSGVVHCDIKTDNIIIQPYADRPVMLIDLDKAYTSWLDSTYGNPLSYGCASCADGKIDFMGLARIAGQLGERRFAKLCRRENVTVEKLRREINGNRWYIPMFLLLIPVIIIGLWLFFNKGQNTHMSMTPHVSESEDSYVSDSIMTSVSEHTDSLDNGNNMPSIKEKSEGNHSIVSNQIDDLWIKELVKSGLEPVKILRDSMFNMLSCDTLPLYAVSDSIQNYFLHSLHVQSDIIYKAVDKFDDISELEVQKRVRNNHEFLEFVKRDNELREKLLELVHRQ